MPRPDRSPDPHPVPTQRRVMISAIDRHYNKAALDTLLAARGFDLALPYHEEATDVPDATLYVQDIPQDAP